MSNIILLEESLPSIKRLSDEEAGALLKALILHTECEEPVDLPDRAELLYPFLVGQMDRMNRLSERRAAAGRIGGSKTKANFKQTSSKSETNVKQIESKREAPIPIPIPNKEKEIIKKEKVDLPDTGVWADEKVRKAFAEYARMRARIRKAMTPEAVRRKIPQLERLANADCSAAVAIINRATDNCWLDFYADKSNGATAKPKDPGYIKRGTDYDAFLNGIGV